jgi:hypothetical protein
MSGNEEVGMAARPLRGLEHASAFLRLYDFMKRHGTKVGSDPMIEVNNVILTHYMRAVEEDPKAGTGFSYRKGRNDQWVRRNAQAELGIAVEVHQVVAVRRFLASLFKTGFRVQDVVRVRRMFFGRIAGE